MDDLNNKQIILLAMLVSFVMSIATGIITVSLLEEAPQTVTQTVNRIVERTIERVVSEDPNSTKPTPVTTITKEVTVYAKEDDLVVGAVEKNQTRVATIYAAPFATSSAPLATGFVVSRDGLIVTSARSLAGAIPKDGYAVIADGKFYLAKPVFMEGKSSIAFIKVSGLTEKDGLNAVTFGSTLAPKLAQTAVVLGGSDGTSIFKTTLSRLIYGKAQGTSSPAFLGGIETTPRIPDENEGALVVNLDAQSIGIALWDDATSKYVIFPSSRIIDLIPGVISEQRAEKLPETTTNRT